MTAVYKTGVIALSALAFAAFTNAASAAKKMTYEEAFAKCKGEIAANTPMSDTTTSAAKHSAGAGCMKKYGYRLKK